uniref:Glycosyl hydrolase, family 31 protein n=1 Tax=Toxoplasma gondii TgCATBr9 TaxID=943120 RepID=A0A2T6IUZ0_TOXGO|nr:glycosyl hydrolase, family 31 protein [Toxoplasma gondii TgCATBr9]
MLVFTANELVSKGARGRLTNVGCGLLSFPACRAVERIVLWAVESPPTRVVVRRESPLRVEEAPDKLAEEEVEGEKEEELFFSSEEIVAPHHETQTQLLGGKTFFRVNVKLPKIDVGKNDWQVLFHF